MRRAVTKDKWYTRRLGAINALRNNYEQEPYIHSDTATVLRDVLVETFTIANKFVESHDRYCSKAGFDPTQTAPIAHVNHSRVFAHIARWYYILHPDPVSAGQALRFIMLTSPTSLQWVPLHGRKFEALHPHAGVRRVMENFYAGLGPINAFARSIQHPLALPSEIECSTGV